MVSKDFLVEEKWATLEVDGFNNIINFTNKQRSMARNFFTLTSVYFLDDISVFSDFIEYGEMPQVSDLLKFYQENNNSLSVHNTYGWLDSSHIGRYHVSKKS